MKKIIFLLAMIPLISFGQVHYHLTSSTMTIWSIENDTLTQGDSAYITVKYGYYLGSGTPDSIVTQLFPQDVEISKRIAIDDLVNYPQNSDGTTTIKFMIPYNAKLGNSTIYFGDGVISLYVKAPIVSGILDPIYKSQEIKYYNIQGSEIPKPTSGFYIWRSSNGQSGKCFIN
jgi:hypothetical protein